MTRPITRSYPLATPGITVAAWRAAVTQGTTLAVPAPEAFGAQPLTVVDRTIAVPAGSAWAAHTLLTRDITLPDGQRVGFVLAAERGRDSPSWSVVAATHGRTARLFGELRVGGDTLRVSRWNPHLAGGGAAEAVQRSARWLVGLDRVDGVPDDPWHDRLLIESAALIAEAYRRQIYLAVAVGHRHHDFWPMYDRLLGHEAHVWADVIVPLLPGVATAIRNPLPSSLHPDLGVRVTQRATKMLLGADGQAAHTIHGEIETEVRGGARELTYATEDALFSAWRDCDDADRRAAIYRKGITELAPIIRRGWLDRIPELNALARRAGAADYAELIVGQRYGEGTQAYHDMVMEYCTRTGPQFRRLLAQVKKAAGVKTLRPCDVPYGLAMLARQSNVSATLSRTEALAIIGAIMCDLGCDLTQAPFDQIVFDIEERAEKLPAGPMSSAVDPSATVVFANFGERLTLKELMILTYETLHAVHYAAGVPRAEGWLLLSDHDEAPRQISKAIADLAQRLFTTPALLHHYLRPSQRFSRDELSAFCAAQRIEYEWRIRRCMLLALYEMLCYRRRLWTPEAPPLDDDELLMVWHTWVRDYLGLTPHDELPFGDWITKPAFTSRGFYLSFASYTWGLDYAARLGAALQRGRRGLQAVGGALRPLMERGGRATKHDLDAALVRLRASLVSG